ncbi:hypothetical protein D9758_007039 [Tetrapyrgos nigripes]|uniref:Uncharacterized protein n=1 Tax=Tetrapyrgos nigripes TaxID=182062 RepID=A0A8H5GDJ9_9AGAR|nr:hypothetical protein D9758_007039 [Tetrapyrgos nigripes]
MNTHGSHRSWQIQTQDQLQPQLQNRRSSESTSSTTASGSGVASASTVVQEQAELYIGGGRSIAESAKCTSGERPRDTYTSSTSCSSIERNRRKRKFKFSDLLRFDGDGNGKERNIANTDKNTKMRRIPSFFAIWRKKSKSSPQNTRTIRQEDSSSSCSNSSFHLSSISTSSSSSSSLSLNLISYPNSTLSTVDPNANPNSGNSSSLARDPLHHRHHTASPLHIPTPAPFTSAEVIAIDDDNYRLQVLRHYLTSIVNAQTERAQALRKQQQEDRNALEEFYSQIADLKREAREWFDCTNLEAKEEQERIEEEERRELRRMKQNNFAGLGARLHSDRKGKGKVGRSRSLKTLQESRIKLYEEQVVLKYPIPTGMRVGEVSSADNFGWRWLQCPNRVQVLLPPDASYRYAVFLKMEGKAIANAKAHTSISPSSASTSSGFTGSSESSYSHSNSSLSSSSSSQAPALSLRKFDRARTVFISACFFSRPEYPVRGITPTDRRFALEPGFKCDAIDEIVERNLEEPVDMETFAKYFVTNRRVGTVGAMDVCSRRWVKVEEHAQVLFPPDIAFQYYTFLTSSESTFSLSHTVFMETLLQQCLVNSKFLREYEQEKLYILSRNFFAPVIEALRVFARANDIKRAKAVMRFARYSPELMVRHTNGKRRVTGDNIFDLAEDVEEVVNGNGKDEQKNDQSVRRSLKSESIRGRMPKEKLVSKIQETMEELEPIHEIPSCGSDFEDDDSSMSETSSLVSITLVGTRDHTPRQGGSVEGDGAPTIVMEGFGKKTKRRSPQAVSSSFWTSPLGWLTSSRSFATSRPSTPSPSTLSTSSRSLACSTSENAKRSGPRQWLVRGMVFSGKTTHIR